MYSAGNEQRHADFAVSHAADDSRVAKINANFLRVVEFQSELAPDQDIRLTAALLPSPVSDPSIKSVLPPPASAAVPDATLPLVLFVFALLLDTLLQCVLIWISVLQANTVHAPDPSADCGMSYDRILHWLADVAAAASDAAPSPKRDDNSDGSAGGANAVPATGTSVSAASGEVQHFIVLSSTCSIYLLFSHHFPNIIIMPDNPPAAAAAAATRKGTGKDCRIRIPDSDKYKKCAKCRAQNAGPSWRKRARARERRDNIAAADADRDGGESDGDGPAPAKRMRAADGSAVPIEVSSKTSDDYKFYEDEEQLYADLRAAPLTSSHVHFKGCFKLPVDASESPKERVKSTNRAVLRATGYRCEGRLPCAVEETGQNPDFLQFSTYDANEAHRTLHPNGNSWGAREADDHTIFINLQHSFRHNNYEDHSFPDAALAMVHATDEEVTPSALARRIRNSFTVLNAQVYNAWREKNGAIWRRDVMQLLSAWKLLKEYDQEVDLFDPENVPEGVEILCWGMKEIAMRLRGEIVEVAMDATHSTNAKDLKLYALMGEFDNAGFPLAYCLLSTTSSISRAKHIKLLTAFAACVRKRYDLLPEFVHVDKDLGEINALNSVFNAKTSICWWHVNNAVGKRIKLTKMSTTPYNTKRAHAQFSFIQLDFRPEAKPDKKKYEGGKPRNADTPNDKLPATQNPSKLTFKLRLPAPVQPLRTDATSVPVIQLPLLDSLDVDGDESSSDSDSNESGSESEEDDDWEEAQDEVVEVVVVREAGPQGKRRKKKGTKNKKAKKQRTPDTAPKARFMPEDLQAELVAMMQQHSTTVLCSFGKEGLRKFHRLRASPTGTRWSGRGFAIVPMGELVPPGPMGALDTSVTPDYSAFTDYDDLREPHLVQLVERVPIAFFREAKRNRTTPFWKHPKLIPLGDGQRLEKAYRRDWEVPENEDGQRFEDEQELEWEADGAAFDKGLDARIDQLEHAIAMMRHQKQFKDPRLLAALNRNGASLFRFLEACEKKEQRATNNRGAPVRTWENGDAMFYRPRPRVADRNT
ncbi:SWIM-type domain-containing protein [Mycena kentingensis (nom. inval.)]|nr:SWIM-type domain-containing protein [Mycena kentingensis (nom. inval.)]